VRKKQQLTSFRVSEQDFVEKPMGTQEISWELHGNFKGTCIKRTKSFQSRYLLTLVYNMGGNTIKEPQGGLDSALKLYPSGFLKSNHGNTII
jgi:hypothetical protein